MRLNEVTRALAALLALVCCAETGGPDVGGDGTGGQASTSTSGSAGSGGTENSIGGTGGSSPTGGSGGLSGAGSGGSAGTADAGDAGGTGGVQGGSGGSAAGVGGSTGGGAPEEEVCNCVPIGFCGTCEYSTCTCSIGEELTCSYQTENASFDYGCGSGHAAAALADARADCGCSEDDDCSNSYLGVCTNGAVSESFACCPAGSGCSFGYRASDGRAWECGGEGDEGCECSVKDYTFECKGLGEPCSP